MEIKNREKQVLLELLKDGRVHDKHIAKKIGTTQPTVTRIRQKLEREGFIRRYRAVADYQKVNVGVFAITFWTWHDYSKKDERHAFMNDLKLKPQVMFLSRGEGIEGRTTCMISAHKDFNEYEQFVRDVRSLGGLNVTRVVQFVCAPDFYKQYDSSGAMVFALEDYKESS